MTRYIIRRLLWGVLLLILVRPLTFVLFRSSRPANPRGCAPGATRAPK